MTYLSLRIRIFLFFALMAAGAVVVAGGAMAFGWSRAETGVSTAPFVTGFIVFALLNTGLLLGIWLLFDENVAKPIIRLSSDLRMRVHTDVGGALDTDAARYLGDLAPAAAALTEKAEATVEETAADIARQTERLSSERERLTALLTQSPLATILVNEAHEIVLYDAQAACVLAEISAPRLKAPLSDYFTDDSLRRAFADSQVTESECDLRPVADCPAIAARIKRLDGAGHMVFFDPPDQMSDTIAQRPLVFDFDLMSENRSAAFNAQRLSDLCYVVLDLETTGLSVDSDAIVQIGAVRVLNGTRVPGEEVSTYVNPGRPIPPASSRIHHVTDAHVADAPDMSQAGLHLHQFARDAVLVAHNAPFDIGLLKKYEAEIGAKWDHPVLDTVLLSAVAFGTTEEHSLDALCDRLEIEIPPEDRHTAYGDALATAEALIRLLKMLEGQGYQTFADLQPDLDRQARHLYTAS